MFNILTIFLVILLVIKGISYVFPTIIPVAPYISLDRAKSVQLDLFWVCYVIIFAIHSIFHLFHFSNLLAFGAIIINTELKNVSCNARVRAKCKVVFGLIVVASILLLLFGY